MKLAIEMILIRRSLDRLSTRLEMAKERKPGARATVLIHNPNAQYPLPPKLLNASAEEKLEDGKMITTISEMFHPYASMTMNFPGNTPTRFIQTFMDK